MFIKDINGNAIEFNYKSRVLNKNSYNIILCHGFGSSKMTFDPIFLNLSASYNCYAIDLPGHGETKGREKDMKLPYLANSIKQFIEILNLDNVLLIGHSLGGGVISYLWNNEKIKAFIFISPINPSIVTKEKYLSDILLPSTFKQLKQSWKKLVYNFSIIDSHFFSKENSSFLLKKIEKFRFLHGSLALDVWKKNRQWEIVYNYLSLQKKCMVIFGNQDLIIPTDNSIDWLSKLLKNANFSIINECGHIPHFEKPKETLSLIFEFIQGL